MNCPFTNYVMNLRLRKKVRVILTLCLSLTFICVSCALKLITAIVQWCKTSQRYVEVKNVALHVKINQTHQDIEIVSTSLATSGKYFWTPKLT